MGKLIVFEGIDGSGKSTQYKMLCDYLSSKGRDFMSLEFPQYHEPSSSLIKMYLSGEFGSSPGDVNAYAASSFYAVDRYASYKKFWGPYYQAGGLVVAGRYTTSNAVHQAAKLDSRERSAFFKWLYEYEFKLMGMPAPDKVLYFRIPVKNAADQIMKRRLETGAVGDIHENDLLYLQTCCETAEMAADYYDWTMIEASIDGRMRSPVDIHSDVLKLIVNYL